ncbi:MAG: hypothetical protein C4582_01115 [Desulfobacteraceae bacterium]|nr:MAG: hypothetical protein C4582_01115 [Desulfobacteraceae bacterium]
MLSPLFPNFPTEIESAIHSALEMTKEAASEALRGFISSMERRLKRDIANTREYYEAMAREMTEGLNRPGLGEAQKLERKAKTEDLPSEAQRKIDDLRQKYRIRLKVMPSGAVRILTDVVQLMVTVQYKRLIRDISIFWNQVTLVLDPLVCETCGKTLQRAYCR